MDTLLAVITIKEAAQLWGKHPNTIRLARDVGRLCGRRTTDGRWLITTESLRKTYGQPKQPLETLLLAY